VTPKDKLLLDQISALTKLVRSTWLGLLVVCAYTWLAVALQSDLEILENAVTLELPVIGSKISPSNFYLAAPAIILVISIYLHVLISRLWRLYSLLPRNVDGLTSEDAVEPWLGVTFLPNASHPRLFVSMARLAGSIFVWLMPISAIAVSGGRYVSPNNFHIVYHSFFLAAILVSTGIIAGFTRSPLAKISNHSARVVFSKRAIDFTAFIFLALVLISRFSDIRTLHINTWANTRINISDSVLILTRKDKEFPKYADSRQVFREEFCPKKNILNIFQKKCPEDEYQEANVWQSYRRSAWEILIQKELTGFHIKRAEAKRIFAPRIILIDVSFIDTNLTEANLEGAEMNEVNFSGSDLSDVLAPFADLREAKFQNAGLYGTQFQYARLGQADFSGANVRHVDFERASIVDFQLLQSKPTKFNGAVVIRSMFEGASMNSEYLGNFVDFSSGLVMGNFVSNQISAPNALVFLRLNGVRDMFLPNELNQNTKAERFHKLASVIAVGTAFRFFDLKSPFSAGDDPTWETSFADGTVELGTKIERPCQWRDRALNDEHFFGYWRGWYNIGNRPWPPSETIGDLRIKVANNTVFKDGSINIGQPMEIKVSEVEPLTPFGWDEETQTEYPCTWPTAN